MESIPQVTPGPYAGTYTLDLGERSVFLTTGQARHLCAELFAAAFLPDPGPEDTPLGERLSVLMGAVNELVADVLALGGES